jgi:hypothetical protein
MKDMSLLPAVALLFAVTLIPVSALAQNGHHRDAPAPLIGASLPGLAIGYGVYWLIRRRRKVD